MIKEWRKKRSWTQRQLAETIGYTDGYIAHLENEQKLPSLDICIALSEAFRLSHSEQQELLRAVDIAHQNRSETRIHTRSSIVRGALRTRGSVSKPSYISSSEAVDPEEIVNDMAVDPELRTAYNDLKISLADPNMRETVLNALRSFAQTAKSRLCKNQK